MNADISLRMANLVPKIVNASGKYEILDFDIFNRNFSNLIAHKCKTKLVSLAASKKPQTKKLSSFTSRLKGDSRRLHRKSQKG